MSGDARITNFERDVAQGRYAYVPGTPEKYPGTKCVVRVLDAEAVLRRLAELEQALLDLCSPRRLMSRDQMREHAREALASGLQAEAEDASRP